MPDDVFKLPQSSYDTVCKIVMSYTQVGSRTSLAQISKIMGTDSTVVSRNIGFLLGIGILEGGRDKGITPLGSTLGRALEFGQQDEIANAWRQALGETALIQRILAAIRVRGGMDTTTLQTQIVYTAGVSKTSGTMTGGAAVIEMLRASGLITDQDGKYIAPSTSEAHIEPAREAPSPIVNIVQNTPAAEVGKPVVTINIDVRVAVSAEQLRQLGPELRQLIADLAAPLEDDPTRSAES